jgi:hypothetical protein
VNGPRHRVVDEPGAADAAATAVRPAAWRQIVVLGFVCALVALGVRTLVHDDARFGWGMFAHNVAYTVHYEWVLRGGGAVAYVPGDELRGRASRLTLRSGTPWVPRIMLYGQGTLRSWVQAYLRHLFDTRRPDDAVAVRARIRTAVNPISGRAPSAAGVAVEELRYPSLERQELESGGRTS